MVSSTLRSVSVSPAFANVSVQVPSRFRAWLSMRGSSYETSTYSSKLGGGPAGPEVYRRQGRAHFASSISAVLGVAKA